MSHKIFEVSHTYHPKPKNIAELGEMLHMTV